MPLLLTFMSPPVCPLPYKSAHAGGQRRAGAAAQIRRNIRIAGKAITKTAPSGGTLRLVQFKDRSGGRKVAVVSEDSTTLRVLAGVTRSYDLALAAARSNTTLEAAAKDKLGSETANFDEVVDNHRLLPPLDHPDPYHCLISGTGLSHLGSAAARDSMHVKLKQAEAEMTDSMKMFKWGVEGGKPSPGQIGVA